MERQQHSQIERRSNAGGPTVASASRPLIAVDGLWFRDLAGTGELIPAADHRLDAELRARDLAARLGIEQIAGLMLYSPHQMVPAASGPFAGHYDGEPFDPARHRPDAVTDEQRLLLRDHLRHVLVVRFADVDTAVGWHNAMQRLAEQQPWSIPINFSSDPRHGATASGAEFKSSGAATSSWPEGIGLAATFSPETVAAFADAVRREYRALGITTALGPQIDLATEPRWMRAVDTFGGDVEQVIAYTRAYVDALQSTPGAPGGWGPGSVIAMVKHWPGGGTGEGGRDAHYRFGMYNVYPGGNAADHLRPFTEGAFALPGPTGAAGAVMPYYSVSVGLCGARTTRDGEEREVGNAYSPRLIADLLRGRAGYDGVVCTDWRITGDSSGALDGFESRNFGVEDLSVAERCLLLIENGVDQFGGDRDVEPVLAAYRLGCERHGEAATRARFERSAVRLLRGMFRVGLFDDPYLELEQSRAVVGSPALVAAGRAAQLASVVALKDDVGPLAPQSRVWVPARHVDAHPGFFRTGVPAADLPGLGSAATGRLRAVEDPAQADAAVVVLHSPISDPYVEGFRPISLQYGTYRADTARERSLAGDRSYRGRESVIANAGDLAALERARAAMGDRPVIAVVRLDTPVIMAEIEPLADAVFVHFGVSDNVLVDVLTGIGVPGGRLPYTLPADMLGVEASHEDVFDDVAPYVDSAGNAYVRGFGLSPTRSAPQ